MFKINRSSKDTPVVRQKTEATKKQKKQILKAIKKKDTVRLKQLLAQITSLSLEGNHIGDAEAIKLAQALHDNHTLIGLNLGINQIGDMGTGELAQALHDNHTLLVLVLGGNQVGDVG